MDKNEEIGENQLLFKIKLIEEIKQRVKKHEGKKYTENGAINHI